MKTQIYDTLQIFLKNGLCISTSSNKHCVLVIFFIFSEHRISFSREFDSGGILFFIMNQQPYLPYVDFLPAMLSAGGFLKVAEYERFDVLISRANGFLLANPHLAISICESIEQSVGYNSGVSSEPMQYFESGKHPTTYIRGLRLWLTTNTTGNPVQIGYFNWLPILEREGGFFSMAKFEPLPEMVARLNQQFVAQPLPGRILNVETQDFKTDGRSSNVDCDRSYWMESGKHATFFVYVLRVFYVCGPPANETISVIDVVPQLIKPAGFMVLPQYESFPELMRRGADFMRTIQGRVCNVQSLNTKMSCNWNATVLNTHSTCFHESGNVSTWYVTFLRIYSICESGWTPPNLTERTFMPAQLTTSTMGGNTYETHSQTMARVNAWFAALPHAPPRIVGVVTGECLAYHQSPGALPSALNTFTAKSGKHANLWLKYIRVFFDGGYQEPPPEALPPPPQVVDQGCCTML